MCLLPFNAGVTHRDILSVIEVITAPVDLQVRLRKVVQCFYVSKQLFVSALK